MTTTGKTDAPVKKNRYAVALGRRGGQANTPAQQVARAENGKLGGRPTLYRMRARRLERWDGTEWVALVEPFNAAAKAWLRRQAAG
jgi:hypothetical protein